MNSVALRVPVVFPPNPAIGDEFTASNGATYVWDGVVWMAVGGPGGGGGGGAITEPTGPGTWGRLANGTWQRTVALAGDAMTGDLIIRDPTGAMLIVDGTPTGNATVRLNAADFAALELNSGGDALLTMRLPNGEEFDLVTSGVANSFALRAGGGAADVIFEVDHTQKIARFTVPPRAPVDPVGPDDLARKAYVDTLVLGGITDPINFRATTVMTLAGTELTGVVVATLTIPPADLPDEPFTWIALGQGDGSYFFHNVAPPAAGTVSNTNINVEVNNAGAWGIAAAISVSPAAFPSVGIPVLVRATSTPGQSNVRRYDPAVDTLGIQIRVVIGSTGPTTAYTLTFGVEGRIIQYG